MVSNTVDHKVEIVTEPSLDPDPSTADGSSSQEGIPRWLLRRLVFGSALAIVGFVVFTGVEGLLQANSLDDRIIETRIEIEQLRHDSAQLAALVTWLESDAYIERIAREDLGMVRPGEEAVAVRTPERSQLEINRTPWWLNLLPEQTEDAE